VCICRLLTQSIILRVVLLATCVQTEPSGSIFILVAIAAAFCGYLTSVHGLLISTLVSNLETEQKKRLFMNRLEKVLTGT
jgi:hypothetical protein